MKILISGASGLIGTALSQHLRKNGHEVVTLVRRTARTTSEITWDPSRLSIPDTALDGIDAVINLAGAGVGDRRWTRRYKDIIRNSRVTSTQTIAQAIAHSQHKPQVFINGSAIGIYGNRGDETITEQSSKGAGFLSDVVEDWEAAAASSGVRTIFARTGLVFTPKGGALMKLVPLFKLGLGGVIAGGRQYWSFISLTDEVRALEFLLTAPIEGPVNLTAPHPVTNKEFTKTFAKKLHRPALLPVPGFALRLVLGEFSDDITGGAKILPSVLTNAGFTWLHPTIDEAIDAEVLGQS